MASSDPKKPPRPGQLPPAPEYVPLPPSSWAKRTGFHPKFSGETNATDSGPIKAPEAPPDLESGRAPPPAAMNGEPAVEKVPLVKRRKESDGGAVTKSSNAPPLVNGKAEPPVMSAAAAAASRRAVRGEDVVDEDEGFGSHQLHINL